MTNEISWPESTANDANKIGYVNLSACSAVKITAEFVRDHIRELEWLEYEIAPEWQRFCEFGPQDIGTIWEDIGAIRRRPRPKIAIVSAMMAEQLNRRIEQDIIGVAVGFPVFTSPYMRGFQGYMLTSRD